MERLQHVIIPPWLCQRGEKRVFLFLQEPKALEVAAALQEACRKRDVVVTLCSFYTVELSLLHLFLETQYSPAGLRTPPSRLHTAIGAQ